MSREIEILERLYKSTKDKNTVKDFFISLFDYVEYLNKDNKFSYLFENFIFERKQEEKELEKICELALVEYHNFLNEIKTELKVSKLDNDNSIKNMLIEIDDLLSGKTATTGFYGSICMDLVDVLQKMHDLGNTAFVEKYCKMIPITNENRKGIERTERLEIFNKIREKQDELEQKDLVSIYGAYSRIITQYTYFKEGKKYWDQAREKIKQKKHNSGDILNLMNISIPLAEWDKIMKGNNERNSIFKEKETRIDLDRIHNYILINYTEEKEIKDSDEVYFDIEFSKIICNKKEVKLIKGKDLYYIIKYLFERKDVYEECFYDEIIDYSELDKSKKRTDKQMYDALFQFNKRMIDKGINDLFKIDFHSVKINTKYKIIKKLHDKTR